MQDIFDSMYHKHYAWTCLTVWLLLNTMCNFANRILLHNLGWAFPILLTILHGATSMIMHLVVTEKLKWIPFERISMDYFKQVIFPAGFVGLLTVVMNNIGLVIVDVATVQVIKSLTPLFTALFAYVVSGKTESKKVITLFIITTVGVYFTLKEEPKSERDSLGYTMYIGYILILGSSCARAMSNILSERIMNSMLSFPKLHPLSLVFYSAPIELGFLLPTFLFVELPSWTSRYMVQMHWIFLVLLVLLNCLMIFGLRYYTNEAIKVTSALTTTVFAQVKFVISVLISCIFFDYNMTWVKLCGLLMVVGGTLLYGLAKTQKQEKELESIV